MGDVCIEIDESSISTYSNHYSDEIDSDTEAELYSLVHHQEHVAHVSYSPGKSTPESSKILNNSEMRETSFILHENIQTNTRKSLILAAQNVNSVTKKLFKKGDLKQDENSCSISLNCKSGSEHDSLSDILCLDDSRVEDLPQEASSVNNKNDSNSSENPFHLQEKEIIVIESSDSDNSVLWTEPECSDQNIEANVFTIIDTVSIDSDSSNSSLIISSPLRDNFLMNNLSVPSTEANKYGKDKMCKQGDNFLVSSLSVPSTEADKHDKDKMCIQSVLRDNFIMNNLSVPSTKANKHGKDPWCVNKEDLYRQKRRCYRKKKCVLCYKCYRKGHATKMCPVPHVVKCFICGDSHVGTKCKRRICKKCFKSGHDASNCSKIYPGVCSLCKMKGHSEIDCPDIWRRYHLTTEPSNIVQGMLKMKQNRTFYCFNCGVPGHFGTLCNHSRMKGSLCTWPAVLSYENPEALLRGRLNNITNVNDFKNDVIVTNFENDAILDVSGQLNTSQNNANSNKRKIKCTSKTNANPKRRKLNASQGFTSHGKNAQEKTAAVIQDKCSV